MLYCKYCNLEKNETEFAPSQLQRKTNKCRECVKKDRRIYYLNNKENEKIYHQKYNKDNKEKIKIQKKEYDKKYRQLNKKKRLAHNIEYKKNNSEKLKIATRKREKNRRKSDICYRLQGNVSQIVRHHLKRNGGAKNNKSCLKYLPFSSQQLCEYLKSQWINDNSWMTWDNYGVYNKKTWDDNNQSTWTWNLDHIAPCSDFYYTSMEDQSFKDCWALSNLRPLNAKQNTLDGVNRTRHIKKD